jgi:poly-gamma-glutamate synthesis protein (capsule biosynthesis protein)
MESSFYTGYMKTMDIISQNSEKEWVVHMTTQNDNSECELLFVGDVALARRIGDNVENNTADFPFAKLNKKLFNNDAFIFNLECCLSDRGDPWEPKPEFMRGKGEYLDVLKSIPAEKYIANISNNHFLDYGSLGAKDTLSNLEKHDMEYIGAVINSKVSKPYVMTIKGIKIALLALSKCTRTRKEYRGKY